MRNLPGAPLPWEEAPLSEVADFAREHRDRVTVLMPAAARTMAADDSRVTGVPIDFEGWPQAIVAAIYPSRDTEQALAQMAKLDGDDIRSVVYHFGEFNGVVRALRAREAESGCRGVLITQESPEGADLAWRGLPAEE